MEHMISVWSASFPQLVVLLLVVVFSYFVLREWRLTRRELADEIRDRVQAEIGNLTGDIVKKSQEARHELQVLAELQSNLHVEREKFDLELKSAKKEIERILEEVRERSSEVEKLAPTRRDLEWISPDTLVRLAKQASDWKEASSYLARIDHENATSKDLEIAGDICRNTTVRL